MDVSELFSSLPATPAPDRGLLEALSGIGVRDGSRAAVGEVSASQALLAAKRCAATEEETAAAAAPPVDRLAVAFAAKATAAQEAAATPSAMLHASLVAGHRANMDEILARRHQVENNNSKQPHFTLQCSSVYGRCFARWVRVSLCASGRGFVYLTCHATHQGNGASGQGASGKGGGKGGFHGSRPNSKRQNKKGARGAEKAEEYADRLTSKNGGRAKRTDRMNVFKKQY